MREDKPQGYTRLTTINEIRDNLYLAVFASYPGNPKLKVKYTWDGYDVATADTAPYSTELRADKLTNGEHELKVTTSCLNTTYEQYFTVKVDNGKVTAKEKIADPAVSEPTVDVPAVDEPAVDEPAVDEPIADEPAVDEPAVDEQPSNLIAEENDIIVSDDESNDLNSDNTANDEQDDGNMTSSIPKPILFGVGAIVLLIAVIIIFKKR